MTLSHDRDGPRTKIGGERQIFARTAAYSPSRPERIPQEAFSNIAHAGLCLQFSPHPDRELADKGLLIHDSGWQPAKYFSEDRLIVIGTPDSGGRSKVVYDITFGVFTLPPDDNSNRDLGLAGVRVPPIPPVLEGGAAVRIEEEEVALVG